MSTLVHEEIEELPMNYEIIYLHDKPNAQNHIEKY
jgi:hypothetical protein